MNSVFRPSLLYPLGDLAMTTRNASVIDRQALLACIPEDWKIKFKEGLGRSPILRLVAMQVSQQVIETYRHRLEMALRTGEAVPQKRQSPYLQISHAADGQVVVGLSRAGESLQRPLAATEDRVAQFFQTRPFWAAAATYMWHDLIQIAYAAMTAAIAPPILTALDQSQQLETLYRYIFDETSDSLTSNFSDILAVYIDQAVQLVLEHDDLATKSLKELEGLAGMGQKAAPQGPFTNPDLFVNRTTHNFATCKLLWESVNVLTQRTDLLWQPDADGKLAYTRTLNDGRGKLIFWVTDDLEAQSPESLAGEAALTVIETFDIRAACMHLIYAAHVTTLDRPWEEEFVIDDTQIAAYLGLDKRKDLTKEKRLKLIERIAEQPAQILTFLHWPQQGQIESFYVEKSRLWEVAIGYHGQRDIFGGIKCTGLTIRCRAGMWAKYFLNKRGADEGAAFYQYGVLSKTLLQTINRVWQHSEGAARMLSWLSFKTRVSTNQTIMTATLMEVAYGVNKVTAAQRDRDLRSELANTWDNDLRILCDAGMMVEFDPITYPVEIQPDWTEGGRGLNKRPNGFWDQLRTSKLKILPPQDIADGIARLRKKKSSDSTAHPVPLKRGKQAPLLNGEQIKAARAAKGWSQEDLGKQLSRTKMWVSLIERGKRSIKPEDAAQLQDLLGL